MMGELERYEAEMERQRAYAALHCALYDLCALFDRVQRLYDPAVPYDHNPVVMVKRKGLEDRAEGLHWLLSSLGCAGVLHTGTLRIFGREASVDLVCKGIRAGRKHSATVFNAACVQACKNFAWSSAVYPEKQAAIRQRDKVAWEIVQHCPRLRDRRYPTEARLLANHGGRRLLGMRLHNQ